jgi:glycosyltransferase involved in cell wall biosynthesis
VSARRQPPELVSVVVPLLDDEAHLSEQLGALARQDYRGAFEVVIADNGSTDGSLEIARGALPGLRGGRIVDADGRRSAGHARNAGAAAARGDFLAFTDADDVVRDDWLSELAAAARDADVVAGGVDIDAINAPVPRSWHVRPPRVEALNSFRFLLHASGSNTGIWADVFRELGGYDEAMAAGEDIDLSWRAQVAGRRLVTADRAVLQERLRPRVRAMAAQHYGYGKAAPDLYARFRSAGMPPPRLRQTLRRLAWLAMAWPAALWSPRVRGLWALGAAIQAGRVVGSVRRGVFYV